MNDGLLQGANLVDVNLQGTNLKDTHFNKETILPNCAN
mgnify:CR=1 FL=1